MAHLPTYNQVTHFTVTDNRGVDFHPDLGSLQTPPLFTSLGSNPLVDMNKFCQGEKIIGLTERKLTPTNMSSTKYIKMCCRPTLSPRPLAWTPSWISREVRGERKGGTEKE